MSGQERVGEVQQGVGIKFLHRLVLANALLSLLAIGFAVLGPSKPPSDYVALSIPLEVVVSVDTPPPPFTRTNTFWFTLESGRKVSIDAYTFDVVEIRPGDMIQKTEGSYKLW